VARSSGGDTSAGSGLRVLNRLLPVVLRNDVHIEDPLGVVLGFLEAWQLDVGDPSRPASFDESDLRLANRGGARISAAEIAAILERRRTIERALRGIAPRASLVSRQAAVPWRTLTQLFDAFGGIRGVGFSKMTKALHPKRPALIPMLDSVVQAYLQDDHVGADASFGARARARPRLQTRPRPELGSGASGAAGDRDARLPADGGASPRSADLVRPGGGLRLAPQKEKRSSRSLMSRLSRGGPGAPFAS
jgi:Family of unknown function (DUF6308)